MNNERIDTLTAQYVWAIQSDGDWYHKAQNQVRDRNYGGFRRITGNFIKAIERMQEEKLSGIEWAYILMELWVCLGGVRGDCLSDPGTLREKYLELLDLSDSSTGTPDDVIVSSGFVRKAGEKFCTYGVAYTYKPSDHSRQGHTYSFAELEVIRAMYRNGSSMNEIADATKRTGLGICEKMRNIGLIECPDGDYICKEDVPRAQPDNSTCNPCGEILLEVAAHTELAAGHLDRVAEALETMNKEKHMTIATNPNTAIETKVVIFGQDAATMSEQQLIDAIKKVEGQIAALKEVKTSSKKIAGNIKELEKQLDAIVAVLDAR